MCTGFVLLAHTHLNSVAIAIGFSREALQDKIKEEKRRDIEKRARHTEYEIVEVPTI